MAFETWPHQYQNKEDDDQQGTSYWIPNITVGKDMCMSCLFGKQTRQSAYWATRPLKLNHGDLWWPITPPIPARKGYVFFLINYFSHYMLTVLLTNKTESFDKFKRFKTLSEQETRAALQTFRTDRGEFVSQESSYHCTRPKKVWAGWESGYDKQDMNSRD